MISNTDIITSTLFVAELDFTLIRSEGSIIQTIGRASRNLSGKATLYADKITGSMERAIKETNRRREIQKAFNKKHSIKPQGIKKSVSDIMEGARSTRKRKQSENKKNLDLFNLMHPINNSKRILRLYFGWINIPLLFE